MPPFGDRSEKQRASDVSIDTPTWILSLKQVRTVTLWICIFTFFSLSLFLFLSSWFFLIVLDLGFSNIVMGYIRPLSTFVQIPKLVQIATTCGYLLFPPPSFTLPYSPLTPLPFLSPSSGVSFLFF